MAYTENKKPGELSPLTSLANDDVIIVGDTSDTIEVAKGITKANLVTDLGGSFATTGHTHTGVYEPADATILKDADIGVSVAAQAHNHTGVYAPVLGADDNYVTDAEKTKLSNLSGTNTGDQTLPTDATIVTTDVTTNNASTSKHGWFPKLPTATGLFLKDDLTWATPSGSGNVSKVGTPANNQVGVWTGDGTIEGDTALTFDTATDSLYVGGNVELGHASDTTLTRASAGVVAVEGVTVPTISSTNTLTNKRITKRVGSTTSSATPTINTDDYDIYKLTAQAVDITSFTTNLSGTPTDGQTLMIQITGTAARAITWGASFEASTVALPTTTVSTNRLDVGFIWNTATSKWRCIASC